MADRANPTMVVQDERRRPHVYMLTTAASVYYQNMTRHERMTTIGQACRAVANETLRATIQWAISEAADNFWKTQQFFAQLGLI